MTTALIQIDPPKILKMHREPTRVKPGDVYGVVPGTQVVAVVELDRPDCDYRTHSCQRLEPVINNGQVEIGWELVRHTDEQIVQAIKQRTNEVITARFPEHTQRNMTAYGLLITYTKDKSPEATAKANSFIAAFGWIEAVRAKSNELEAALIADGTLPDFASLEVPFV